MFSSKDSLACLLVVLSGQSMQAYSGNPRPEARQPQYAFYLGDPPSTLGLPSDSVLSTVVDEITTQELNLKKISFKNWLESRIGNVSNQARPVSEKFCRVMGYPITVISNFRYQLFKPAENAITYSAQFMTNCYGNHQTFE